MVTESAVHQETKWDCKLKAGYVKNKAGFNCCVFNGMFNNIYVYSLIDLTKKDPIAVWKPKQQTTK
jgi:hypothetical protein